MLFPSIEVSSSFSHPVREAILTNFQMSCHWTVPWLPWEVERSPGAFLSSLESCIERSSAHRVPGCGRGAASVGRFPRPSTDPRDFATGSRDTVPGIGHLGEDISRRGIEVSQRTAHDREAA